MDIWIYSIYCIHYILYLCTYNLDLGGISHVILPFPLQLQTCRLINPTPPPPPPPPRPPFLSCFKPAVALITPIIAHFWLYLDAEVLVLPPPVLSSGLCFCWLSNFVDIQLDTLLTLPFLLQLQTCRPERGDSVDTAPDHLSPLSSPARVDPTLTHNSHPRPLGLGKL